MDQSGGGQSMLSGSTDSGTSKKQDIVIHTMQDDIALARKAKALRSQSEVSSKASKVAPPVVDKVTNRKSENKVSLPVPEKPITPPAPLSSQSLPLPPKPQVNESQKVVMAPPKKYKKKPHLFLKFAAFALILVIIAGTGVFGWTFISSNYLDQDILDTPGVVADLSSVVPKDIVMMVSYSIDSNQDASSIINAWQNASDSGTVSVSGLLEGDPRYLLENYSVQELHYFLLSGDSRPYLLIPITEETRNLVDSMSVGQVLSEQGWYLLHAFDTDLYKEKIALGTWVDKDGATSEFRLLDNKVGLILGQELLLSARQSWGNSGFATGQLEALYMNGSFLEEGKALSLNGIAGFTGYNQLSITANQRLLEIVPSNIDIVRLGANFAEDLEDWNTQSNILDSSLLERPVVGRILEELSTSYAYYLRRRQDGTKDIGLIISTPTSLRDQLALGDPALEEALPALIPLIAQRSTQASYAFTDHVYNDVPLRYVNISGPNQALDYAIVDDYILIATSKEGMFALIDSFLGNDNSLNIDNYWQDMFRMWGTLPQTQNIVIGRINNPLIGSLLPIVSMGKELIFGFTTEALDDLSVRIKGVMVLDNEPAQDVSPADIDNVFDATLEEDTFF